MRPNLIPVLLRQPYVGPRDVTGIDWTAWYGLRAYSAAVAATGTQKAVNVRASGDNATTDILILPNGALDVATALAFQTAHGGNLFVTKLYDQSGNLRDATQGTAANQPQLLLSGGSNNLPYILFSASKVLSTASFNSAKTGQTISAVATRNPTSTSEMSIGASRGSAGLFFFTSANSVRMFGSSGGGLGATASDAVWHSFQALENGAASALTVDGVTTSGSDGSGAVNTTAIFDIGASNGTFFLTGGIATLGLILTPTLSAGQISALAANDRTYYGTP